MRNLFLLVVLFAIGCNTSIPMTPTPEPEPEPEPALDLCEETCASRAEYGCAESDCYARCTSGREHQARIGCEAEHTAFVECWLSQENLCEVAGVPCPAESAALTACGPQGRCTEVCDQLEANGCGFADCHASCVDSHSAASTAGIVEEWHEWTLCELGSTQCGACPPVVLVPLLP